MRKITCDWCGKEDKHCKVFPKWYDETETIDLCEDCEEVFYKIEDKIITYRNKLQEQLNEKVKNYTEMIVNQYKKIYEEEY